MPEPAPEFAIIPKQQPTFYFIGVTTGKSVDAEDLPAVGRSTGPARGGNRRGGSQAARPAEAYRQAVAQIKYDPLSLGGLVTTHKIDCRGRARSCSTTWIPTPTLCEEVSCISKRGRPALEGHAKDPLTAGASLDAILGQGYFDGRAGKCSAWARAARRCDRAAPDQQAPGRRPAARFIAVNRSSRPAGAPRAMVERSGHRHHLRVHLQRGPGSQRPDDGRAAAGQHGDQRDRHGQRPARLADHGRRPVPAGRHRLGAQLPRRAGLPAPGRWRSATRAGCR